MPEHTQFWIDASLAASELPPPDPFGLMTSADWTSQLPDLRRLQKLLERRRLEFAEPPEQPPKFEPEQRRKPRLALRKFDLDFIDRRAILNLYGQISKALFFITGGESRRLPKQTFYTF